MDAEAPPSGRGRRILVALLILLLILLPLYLWPLRGGLGGPPGATALPASPLDPRSAAAVARIPDHVWDALMGRADTPAPGPPAPPAPAPRNLTMIAPLDELAGGGFDPGVGESALSGSPASLARAMIAQFGGPSDLAAGNSEGDGSSATPGQFLAGPAGEPGTGNPWSGFAVGGNLGPWNGGGPGGGGSRLQIPGSTFDPGAPEPTPEPATLLLVGSNLALLGAAVWRRRRRGQESPSSG